MKVFLVEDEIIMREGIRNNIDWEKEGFEFVGEASDGELAYPLIQDSKPDILITDIRMPFMDGLELSRRVKEEMPDIKIIILSGYDEFEYAREGIRIGITEYLLKPIDGNKLLEAVKRVAQLIRSELGSKPELKPGKEQDFGINNQVEEEGAAVQHSSARQGAELGILEVGKLDRRVAERFLKTGLKSEVSDFIDDYFSSFGINNIQSLLFRQYVTTDMYFTAVSMLEGLGYENGELAKHCGEIRDINKVLSSVESNKEYLKKVLTTAIDLREAVSRKKYHSLLEEAKSYIQQNYDDANISLNSVAASVNLSPNHFSSIFSQEMGKTFVEYLTSVRMEKAKELLRTSSLKSAEIAYAVGYKDAHYFSYLFKKNQDCTPKEYRQRA
ncbi:MAG: response regulator [Eubacterium sp.]|nr:response regulator [Eubacterium sp.]